MNRQAIEKLIPHTGAMSLLDEVVQWDEEGITCKTRSHKRTDNPFISEPDQPLDTTALLEYGAQAAAVHAALLQQGMAGQGTAFIGAIKQLKFIQRAVDPVIDELIIKAHCQLNTRDGAIYQLDCGSEQQALLSARVILVLPGTD